MLDKSQLLQLVLQMLLQNLIRRACLLPIPIFLNNFVELSHFDLLDGSLFLFNEEFFALEHLLHLIVSYPSLLNLLIDVIIVHQILEVSLLFTSLLPRRYFIYQLLLMLILFSSVILVKVVDLFPMRLIKLLAYPV
jgi:hypothetical protein